MTLGRIFNNRSYRSVDVVPRYRLDASHVNEVSAINDNISTFLGVWMVISLMILIHWNANFLKTISRAWGSLREANNSHCRSCKFYHHNAYLKCAVHPSKVLMAAAQDCSDYCLRQGR